MLETVEKKVEELKRMNLEAKSLGDWQFEVLVPRERTAEILAYMKATGYKTFIHLACIDWIDDQEFELVYNLENYDEKAQALVKVRIPRNKPEMESMMSIWGLCQVYEREIHEFFGINFIGNPNLKPFFLDEWLDIPPLRKDFDTLAFSQELFEFKEDESHGIKAPKRIEYK